MDETYTLRYQIKPGGNYTIGDMHEFQLTGDGTALISIYEPIEADLSFIGGPSKGYLLDSIFQEIDIETGEVLFEWSASSHIPLNATSNTFARCSHNPKNAYNGCGNRSQTSFDYYHLNSIEKDSSGNYLVSGRHTFALSYIDGQTGAVIWNLGGQLNDFEDLSDGQATEFSWQHHARFHEDGKSISLFDNRAHNAWDAASESRAMVIDIDVANHTVELRSQFFNPQQLLSFSQGSLQMSEKSGNVFVGWGRSAAFTEFAADGEVLCDARFGAAAFFSFGAVTSYRVFRDSWVGKPTGRPIAVVVDGNIHVSWNGQTEVAMWQLVQAENDDGLDDDDFGVIATVFTLGFETEIPIPAGETGKTLLVRVVALDKDHVVLGMSDVIERQGQRGMSPVEVAIFMGLLLLIGFTILLCTAVVYYNRRHQQQRVGEEYHGVDQSDEVELGVYEDDNEDEAAGPEDTGQV